MPVRNPANAVVFLLLAVLGGCGATVPKSNFDRLNLRWLDVQRENSDLMRRNEELLQTVAGQNRDIETLRKLGEKRLDTLFCIAGIELGRYTGGLDTDGKDGEEAVKVYLDPVDSAGSVLKAAGDVKIQLFDLAMLPGENLLGEYQWTADRIGSHWSNAMFGGSHFSFICPWKQLPKHDQITIRVEFTDYLTGKTFTAQKVVRVRIPSSLPTSAPASEPVSQPTIAPAAEPSTQPAESPNSSPATAPASCDATCNEAE